MIDLSAVKQESEQYVLSKGGTICDWLPTIDLEEIELKDGAEVASRALAMSMLVYIGFDAPRPLAKAWLEQYGLMDSLTPYEKHIVESTSKLEDDAKNYLRWQVESLWAAAWVGGLSEELWPVQEVSDALSSWFPSLRENESPEKFLKRFKLRETAEIHGKLDLFYRAHWHARDAYQSQKDPGQFHPAIVQQRRHLLEWVTHREDAWDDVDLST